MDLAKLGWIFLAGALLIGIPIIYFALKDMSPEDRAEIIALSLSRW